LNKPNAFSSTFAFLPTAQSQTKNAKGPPGQRSTKVAGEATRNSGCRGWLSCVKRLRFTRLFSCLMAIAGRSRQHEDARRRRHA